MAKIYGALEVAQLEWYTTAGRPSAAGNAYRIIWNTTDSVIQVSDGAAWVNPSVSDGSITRVKLATGAVAKINVTSSKTTTYTATTSDDLVPCNATSAAFTVTLPAAASSTGAVLVIKKTDSSTNAVTIDGNASETIDGALTRKLSTQYESLKIVCDGSNWFVLEHVCPSNWALNAYAFTFSGLGTTSGTNVWTRRIGDSLHVRGYVTTGTPTAVALAINFTGITIDSTKISAVAHQKLGDGFNVQTAALAFASTSYGPWPIFYDGATTTAVFLTNNVVSNTFAKANGSSVLAASVPFTFDFVIPISGWEG